MVVSLLSLHITYYPQGWILVGQKSASHSPLGLYAHLVLLHSLVNDGINLLIRHVHPNTCTRQGMPEQQGQQAMSEQ